MSTWPTNDKGNYIQKSWPKNQGRRCIKEEDIRVPDIPFREDTV